MKGGHSRRFGLLLGTLLLDLLASPWIVDLRLGEVLLNVITTVVLVSALYSVSDNRRRFLLGLALWLLAMAGTWLRFLTPESSYTASAPILTAFLLTYTAYRLLTHVLRSHEVTSGTIYAALCVYVLIGVIWSVLHFGLESLEPGSYRGLDDAVGYLEGSGSSFVYFSFVTLTTVGYGDVTPVSGRAQALSYVEALMGQLYLAVLIARLVGMHIAHQMKDRDG